MAPHENDGDDDARNGLTRPRLEPQMIIFIYLFFTPNTNTQPAGEESRQRWTRGKIVFKKINKNTLRPHETRARKRLEVKLRFVWRPPPKISGCRNSSPQRAAEKSANWGGRGKLDKVKSPFSRGAGYRSAALQVKWNPVTPFFDRDCWSGSCTRSKTSTQKTSSWPVSVLHTNDKLLEAVQSVSVIILLW